MFEKSIILPLDMFNNAFFAKTYFESLSLENHIKIANKLINDFYVSIDPKSALLMIVPQKKQMLEEKQKTKNTLIDLYPRLKTIQTYEQLIQTFNVVELGNIYLNYYKFNTNYFQKINDPSQFQSKKNYTINACQLYPLLVYMNELDDDYIQFPTLNLNPRKQMMLFALHASMQSLKTRLKHNQLDIKSGISDLFALIKLIQKINTILVYSPFKEHYQLTPICTELSKAIEWYLHNIMTEEKINKLSSEEIKIFSIQRALLITSLHTIYLYSSEALTYHSNPSLEELNYAEWCSDKFYADCLTEDYDILGNTLCKNTSFQFDPSKSKRKDCISRYFLNRSLIEAKRGSYSLSIEYYEDFLKNIGDDPNEYSNGIQERIYLNLIHILPNTIPNPALHKKTLNLLAQTISIRQSTKEFIGFLEFQVFIKETKFNIFINLLKTNLEDKDIIDFKTDHLKQIVDLTISKNCTLKKLTKKRTISDGLNCIHYFTQVNVIKLEINSNGLLLNFDNLYEQTKKIAQVILSSIITPKLITPKTEIKLPLLIIPPVSIQEPEKKSELIIETAPVTTSINSTEESTEKLTKKMAKLMLENPVSEKSKKSRHTTLPILSTPVISAPLSSKQVGFKLYPNETVIPVYFGLNQKQKSTNTYLVWDKVDNLDKEAEKHFKSMLDESGVDVARNVGDAGVKIHRPPSEKNDPNFAFIRLKSKSKVYGSTRIFAEFKEQTISALPDNEGKPVYLYSFGRARHK